MTLLDARQLVTKKIAELKYRVNNYVTLDTRMPTSL